MADTLVATISGDKRIADIEVGEWVASAAGYGPVTKVRRTARETVAVVRVGNERVVCSPEHPFLVRGVGWCHADRLEPGMELVGHEEAVRSLRQGAGDPTGAVLLQDLRGEMAGDDAGAAGHGDPPLRGVWRGLREVGCGEVLFSGVHGGGQQQAPQATREGLPGLWPLLSAVKEDNGHMQQGVSRQAGRSDECYPPRTRRAGRLPTELGNRRSPAATVSAVEGAWSRLVRGASNDAAGEPGWGHSLRYRRCAPDAESRGGGRRAEPRASGPGQVGRRQGPLVTAARVDGVEVLQRGDRRWVEVCGGEGPVDLYDLTVGGHPSFTVGVQRLVVHNCMDQDSDSKYNTVMFKTQELQAEEVDSMVPEDGDVGDLLDLPDNLGQQVYCGMDVGLVTDPTVIMIWAVLPDTQRKSRLQLVRMIHVWRFREKQIRQLTYRIARQYGKTLRAFGQDITGLGLPLYQAMEDDERCPTHLKEVSRGYVFNAKMPVAVDKNYVSEQGNQLVDQYGNLVEVVRDKWTGQEQLVAKMTMIEASTRYLRGFVDSGFLLLPFHAKLIADFQGETEQRVRAMGQMKKKPNAFHMLDAARAFAMAYKAGEMEEMVYSQPQRPVMDRAVYVNQGDLR